jgi:drug/metabolite transporter (DMT)-like permease
MSATAPPPATARQLHAWSGVGLAVLAVFLCASADTLIKAASGSISIWQLFVLRSVLVIGGLWALLRRRRVPLRALADRWVLLRSLLLCLMYLVMYTALPSMTMAAFGAAMYTVPLFVTLLSALWLKAPVRPAQWAAVAVGFGGVLLVLRPGTALFAPVALLPMVAALLYATAALITSRKSPHADAAVMGLSLNLGLLLAGLAGTLFVVLLAPSEELAARSPFLLSGWSALTLRQALVIIVLAVLMLAISLTVVRAYQIGPPPLVAVFEYSYLAFVAAWGAVVFGERPDALSLLGMLTLAAAGALALRGQERPITEAK